MLNFEASNLKLDKKNCKDLEIYYIAYVDKKPVWNVNSVNPLFLLINRVHGTVLEKCSCKFLSIDKGDFVLKKYVQVFSRIKYHIKKTSGEEVAYDSNFEKIKFLTDGFLPFRKLLYFPTLTVVIRCVFKQNGIFYPQVYLDECLYHL